jgi:serine/threonine-protein kinase
VYVPAAEVRRQLVLVDRQGRVTPLPGAEGPLLRDPRISPAGDRILLDIDDHVWLYDRNRETLTAVTSGQWNGIYPNWSPDGARIHFSSDAPGSRMLYTVPADGSAEPAVMYDAGDLIWESEWSSDGSWLAYRVGGLSELETMRDILAVQPGRDEPRLLAGTPHNESMLAVSHDGRWLSYVSDESGRREVYVRPFPDGQGRIQVSADGGTEPVWHPEGGELFYRSDGYLVVARVATAGGFRVLDRQRLFADRFIQRDNYANYDVDPRTGQFVMVEGEGEGTGIVVVTDAVAEWWGSAR